MLVFRWVIMLLMVAALVSFALYVGTGQMRFRHFGVRVVKWTLVVVLGFFAVLLLERLGRMV